MAIRTYDILLDSYNSTMPEPIVGRQGDKNGAVTLHVTITDRGTAVNLTGQTVNLIAETANGTAVVADNAGVTLTDAVNGKFDYAIPNALWSESGKITKAYFSLNDTDGQGTTYDLIFIVKKAVDISQGKADDYVTIIDGTIRDLKTKVDAIYTDYQSGNFYNKSETDSKDSATLSGAKAYTDNSLKGISSVPETFANLAAIKSKYPNGANGVMVAADNGHKYIWNGSSWSDAGVYQAVGIADNSISSEKLAYNVQQGELILAGKPVNYDIDTKILTIPDGPTKMVRYGSKTWQFSGEIKIINQNPDDSTAFSLIFDTTDTSFKITRWGYALAAQEILIATFYILPIAPFDYDNFSVTSTANFPFTINGKFCENPELKRATIFAANLIPNINTITKKLEFNPTESSTDIMLIFGGQRYESAIPATGASLDISNLTGTSAWLFLYDTIKNEFFFDKFTENKRYSYDWRYALVTTMRIKNGHYSFDWSIPWSVDGRLFDTGNLVATSQPADALIKSISHRGYNTVAPENTLPAYRLSAQKGYSYVEADIAWTKDNVPVLSHDLTLARCFRNLDGSVINPDISISDLTISDLLSNYDAGIAISDDYKGTPIPRLSEFMRLCRRLNLYPYLDIKKQQTDDQLKQIFNIAKNLTMLNHTTFLSSDINNLKKLATYDNKIRLGLDKADITANMITELKKISENGNEVFYDAMQERLTKDLANQVISEGIPLEIWTVYDTEKLNDYADMGVSGITNNCVNIQEYYNRTSK